MLKYTEGKDEFLFLKQELIYIKFPLFTTSVVQETEGIIIGQHQGDVSRMDCQRSSKTLGVEILFLVFARQQEVRYHYTSDDGSDQRACAYSVIWGLTPDAHHLLAISWKWGFHVANTLICGKVFQRSIQGVELISKFHL